MDYAIVENGTVTNVVVLTQKDLSFFPNAVLIPEGTLTGIGDQYKDGKFYRDGEEITSQPWQEQELQRLNNLLIETQQTITDQDLAMIEAQQTITDLELQGIEGRKIE